MNEKWIFTGIRSWLREKLWFLLFGDGWEAVHVDDLNEAMQGKVCRFCGKGLTNDKQ